MDAIIIVAMLCFFAFSVGLCIGKRSPTRTAKDAEYVAFLTRRVEFLDRRIKKMLRQAGNGEWWKWSQE